MGESVGEGEVLSRPLSPRVGSQLNANERRALSTWILLRWKLQQSPSPFYSPFSSSSSHLVLRIPFVSFSTFPSSRYTAPSRTPFTRRHCFNETGNVQFVRPAPGPWWESCVRPLYLAMHSRSSLGFPAALAKSALLVRNSALSLRACISVGSATVVPSYGVLSRREIISFFSPLSFWKTRKRATPFALVMSLLTRRPRNCE